MLVHKIFFIWYWWPVTNPVSVSDLNLSAERNPRACLNFPMVCLVANFEIQVPSSGYVSHLQNRIFGSVTRCFWLAVACWLVFRTRQVLDYILVNEIKKLKLCEWKLHSIIGFRVFCRSMRNSFFGWNHSKLLKRWHRDGVSICLKLSFKAPICCFFVNSFPSHVCWKQWWKNCLA